MNDAEQYQQANSEYDTKRDEALYIKAKALADGDDDKTRATYTRLRVEQLRDSESTGFDGEALARDLTSKVTSTINGFDQVQDALKKAPGSRNPVEWFLYCLSHYADFDGRASRKEFWSWFGIGLVVLLVGAMLDSMAAPLSFGLFGFFSTVLGIALFVPHLAVTVRRLHDLGQAGFWCVALFVPIVQWLLLIYLCWPSEPRANRYGEQVT